MPSSPALAAKCRGVSPSTSEEFTLAPAAHRSVTMGTLPHAAASWIGVHRVTSCRRDSGKGTAMSAVARQSSVDPPPARTLYTVTVAPLAISCVPSFTSPRLLAMWRGVLPPFYVQPV